MIESRDCSLPQMQINIISRVHPLKWIKMLPNNESERFIDLNGEVITLWNFWREKGDFFEDLMQKNSNFEQNLFFKSNKFVSALYSAAVKIITK